MALADPTTALRDAALHGTSGDIYGIAAPLDALPNGAIVSARPTAG